jgi:hypothetical protein
MGVEPAGVEGRDPAFRWGSCGKEQQRTWLAEHGGWHVVL